MILFKGPSDCSHDNTSYGRYASTLNRGVMKDGQIIQDLKQERKRNSK